MNKTSIVLAFGQFSLGVDVSYTDETQAELIRMGALNVMRGGPATKAESHLMKGVWPESKDGNPQRPKGFERDSIPYTEENVEKLKAGLGSEVKWKDEEGHEHSVVIEVSGVEKRDIAEANPRKRATAFVDSLMGDPVKEAKLRGLMSLYGLPEDASREDMIETAHEHGLGVNTKK